MRGIIRRSLPLTYERARERLRYCRETGQPTWRQHRCCTRIGKPAGAICGKYVQICIDGENYKAHRVIWLMETGEWPECLVDHRDGDGINNRWCNLRSATHRENAMNKRPGTRNTSGFVGVCPDKASGKWEAHIGIEGRTVHLGKFQCIAHAVAVRCQAERPYFGDFARMASMYGRASS